MFPNGVWLGAKQYSWSFWIAKWQVILQHVHLPTECVGGIEAGGCSILALTGCLTLTGVTLEPVGPSTLQLQLCRLRKEKGEVVGKRGPCQLTPRTQGSESWFLTKADRAGGQCWGISSVPVPRRFSPETQLELGQLLSGPGSGQRELFPAKSPDGRPVRSWPGQPSSLPALP